MLLVQKITVLGTGDALAHDFDEFDAPDGLLEWVAPLYPKQFADVTHVETIALDLFVKTRTKWFMRVLLFELRILAAEPEANREAVLKQVAAWQDKALLILALLLYHNAKKHVRAKFACTIWARRVHAVKCLVLCMCS